MQTKQPPTQTDEPWSEEAFIQTLQQRKRRVFAWGTGSTLLATTLFLYHAHLTYSPPPPTNKRPQTHTIPHKKHTTTHHKKHTTTHHKKQRITTPTTKKTKTDGVWPGYFRSRRLAAEKLSPRYEALKIIHNPKKRPGPSDWLSSFTEPGQSFKQYLVSSPVRRNEVYNNIYIQPLGTFTKQQRTLLRHTARYMSLYFCAPVVLKKPLSVYIPPEAKRTNPHTKQTQWHAGYLLRYVLTPRRPVDTLAYIGFTATDLWPGSGWNFVYGLASLRERIGVWSMARNGTLGRSKRETRMALRRTIKIATHETGHILSMKHCTAYECNMNGVNHQKESDTTPLALCPICLRKLIWNTKCDPKKRFRRLERFSKKHGLHKEATFFRRSAAFFDKHSKTPLSEELRILRKYKFFLRSAGSFQK
ncbi:MAG TPA: hypothetical protein DCE42_23830 [Myxococcales bacterium]|nr:hypothetical protein [Deltaproteobacteria bacterium]HAA57817.1 hypothetical protein [Myxococcales bacterium]